MSNATGDSEQGERKPTVREDLEAALNLCDVYFTIQPDSGATSYEKTEAMENIGDYEGGWMKETRLLEVYRERTFNTVCAALRRAREEPEGCICDTCPVCAVSVGDCPCAEEGQQRR